MAFRRPRSDEHRLTAGWNDWIDRHRSELAAIGLPAEVYLDRARWRDFLQNGHLHWHPSSGWEFGHLNAGQLAALSRFLEREYANSDRPPPLLQWTRVRCGATSADGGSA